MQQRTTASRRTALWTSRLLEIRQAPGAGAVAVRAGFSLGVPLVVLVATGHTDLTLYATFGAFTAVYGRESPHRERLRMQVQAGLWLVVCVTVGAAVGVTSFRQWLIVPVAAAVAFAGSLFATRARWRPPGPMFAVFAVAACASLATPAHRVGQAAAVAVATAVLATAAGLVGRPFSADGHPNASGRERPPWPDELAAAARHASAAAVAGLLPTGLGWGHPYWAMVAAVAATSGADRLGRTVRGVQRIVGTLAGVLVTAAVLAPHPDVWVIVAAAITAQMVTELLVGRNYAVALVFVTPLAILMTEIGRSSDPSVLLRDRVVETVIGGAVGILVSLVRRPRAAVAHRRGRAPGRSS